MEQDRYQKNHVLFIIGLLSLIASLIFLGLVLFLLPHLLFGITYDIPMFISDWADWLQEQYAFSEIAAPRVILLFFILIMLFFVLVAYLSSNCIDNQIYKEELKETKAVLKSKSRASMRLFFTILITICLVFVATALLEWLILPTG